MAKRKPKKPEKKPEKKPKTKPIRVAPAIGIRRVLK